MDVQISCFLKKGIRVTSEYVSVITGGILGGPYHPSFNISTLKTSNLGLRFVFYNKFFTKLLSIL